MKRTMDEKKVLRKLGIKDFRHMTKDKVVKFATMLPKMDPDVAKKALEQFPEFKEYSLEIVRLYKDTLDKMMAHNANGHAAVYNACDRILNTLDRDLQRDSIDAEERDKIRNQMIQVAEMMCNLNKQNMKFLLAIAAFGTGLAGCMILAAATAIGGSFTVPAQMEDNDDDKENDDL